MDFEANHIDLYLALGKTFSRVLSFTDGSLTYKTIDDVTQAAPARLTVAGHGIPNGWPFLIQNAQGMTGLNRREAYTATVIDANTVDIADLNTRDFDPYTASSAVMVYSTPADLTDRTGKLSARATRDSSDVLFELTSPSQIVIEPTEKRVTVQMTPTETAALIDTLAGYDSVAYDLELPNSAGAIDLWTWGDIHLLRDV